MDANKNIVVIRDKESVIVRSLEKKFSEMGFNTVFSGIDIKEIQRYSNQAMLFVMYMPTQITENLIKSLVFISDMVMEHDQFFIAIGDKRHYDSLSINIPSIRKNIWLDRPLDMKELTSSVEEVMAAVQARFEKKNILIVDDDPTYARMIRDWLKDYYKTYVVTSGMQAIVFLSKNDIDLILLDYEMPVADGPHVFQMLKEDVKTASIPVIFLTGVGAKQSVAKVMALRPKGYFLKSTKRDELLKNIAEVFEKLK